MYKRHYKNGVKELYLDAEESANILNLKCLAILCFTIIVCGILNEIGIFKVPLMVMRISTVVTIVFLFIPITLFLIHDKILKKENKIIRHKHFKYLIILSAYIGIGIACIALSMHAVVLLAIPPLVAAQYRRQKNMFVGIVIASLILVVIGVYGSFFLGTVDRNFLKGLMTEEEFADIANRIAFATSKRMLDLFVHYIIPRWLGVLAIIMLVSGILKRNSAMLRKQAELNQQVKKEMQQMDRVQRHVIDSLTTLIENRDVGTGEHVVRTKTYICILANRLAQKDKYKDILTPEEIEKIEASAPLHDVGKIVVSDTILLKPGKLTPEEFEQMKVHTTKGGSVIREIFKGVDDGDFLHTAEEIAMYHHERWDGTGYPKGLKGEEIPLCARLMAVADVFDALVSVRVYKPPIAPIEAINIMMSESGTHFDPDIMEAVDEMKDELIRVAMLPLERIQ